MIASIACAGRVAEIQHASRPGLAFVLGDDLRLDAAAVGDDRYQHVGRAREDFADARFEPREEIGVRRRAVLHHFVEPGPELPPRQRREHERIDDHVPRLVERADQVLPERMIDADLAADRAVHLRQQRRRDVGQRDAAKERRRGKTGRVAEDAAAHRDDARAPIRAVLDERIVDASHGLQLLASLAVGNQDDRRVAERPRHGRAVERPHAGLDTMMRRRGKADASSSGPIEERCPGPMSIGYGRGRVLSGQLHAIRLVR